MTSAVRQYAHALEDALHTIISRNFFISVRPRRRNNWKNRFRGLFTVNYFHTQ